MINLFGQYSHNVDAKGRLSLPAKFRKKLPEDLVVMVEPFGHCLYVFDEEGFDEYVSAAFEKKGGYDRLNSEHVELRRRMLEQADSVSIDSAGRINLSATLREKVGINTEVTIIGNVGYFEVWDAKRREEVRSQADLTELLGK